MPDAPILQITCHSTMGVKINNRMQPGLLLTTADIQLLHSVSERDILVSLVCPGQRPYQAHVQALLKRAVQVPGEQVWFVPTSVTGPLKPPTPPSRTE